MKMKTFKHDFGDGVTCTLDVPATPPVDGQGSISNASWSKKPTTDITRRYIAWLNTVNMQLAKDWNMSLCHVFKLGHYAWEAWAYWPNKPPKFLGRSKGELDLGVVKAAADKIAKKMGLPVELFNHVTVEQ
jgi:hypothetical protein